METQTEIQIKTLLGYTHIGCILCFGFCVHFHADLLQLFSCSVAIFRGTFFVINS